MSLMNTIFDYGFKLLDKMMSSSSDSSESNTKSSTDSGLSEEDLKNHLDEYHNQLKNTIRTTVKSAIKDAVLSLENTIKSESNRVIDKIESDQQEKLLSTIKLATFYLEIEDYENAKKLSTDLILLSDYSKNRTQEGKMKWLAPWLISQSTWIAIMTSDNPSEQIRIAVEIKFKEFRIDILDVFGEYLVMHKTCSWIEISNFVNNTGSTIIPKLITAAQKKVDLATDQNSSVEKNTPAKKTSKQPPKNSNFFAIESQNFIFNRSK